MGTRVARVTTAFPSSPKLSRMFLLLDGNTENMFLFLLENTATRKGKELVHFDHQNVNSLCSRYHYVNSSRASSVFSSSKRNTICNQSVRVFS